MKEENKCQANLVLTKINKIKSFKEKVLRIKEEDFKNSSLNQNNKKTKEKSRKKRKKHENLFKKEKLKILAKNELSLCLDNKKLNEKNKKLPDINTKEKNKKNLQPLLIQDIAEERNGRFQNKLENSNSNKIFNTNRTVQLKPISKIKIDSSILPKDNYNSNNIKLNIINSFEENNKENNDSLLKEINQPEENEKKIEKNLLSIDSFKNILSHSLKNSISKIKQQPKKEEQKNNSKNINIIDFITVQKNKNNSTSPNNRGSLSNNKKKKKEKKEYKLQYCVYPGNNEKLIDKVMEYRNENWEKVPTTYSEFCDLVWAPLTSNINFQNSDLKHQYVNHIEFNNEISNKMRLYANLLRHCEEKKIDLFSIFPFTISLQVSHWSFTEQLGNFEKLYKNINKFTPKGNTKFNEMFNVILSKKIGSYQTINIPETFNNGKNLWIIKPVNLNRGRSIKVEKNLDIIIKKVEEIHINKKIHLNEKKKGGDIKCEYLILQKYLEKPLLYQGRKFDIRLWVMIISGKEEDIYIFKQGHLKATCSQYDPDSNDLFVHLTNYSVQKYNENFSKIEIGNEIPFKSFQEELDKNNTGKDFYRDIYPKIVRIVKITGGAAKGKINFLKRKYCFEIFGYDFILDSNYQPYLLEINTNPGLEISSPLIEELLPRMVDDALKLTIDKEFTKSNTYSSQESTFPVIGYDNSENMWEKFSII